MGDFEGKTLWLGKVDAHIEDDWAAAHSANFQLLYANSLARIYKINGDNSNFPGLN